MFKKENQLELGTSKKKFKMNKTFMSKPAAEIISKKNTNGSERAKTPGISKLTQDYYFTIPNF